VARRVHLKNLHVPHCPGPILSNLHANRFIFLLTPLLLLPLSRGPQ
jgi:hypothetical protein